MSIKVYLIL